jgi:hypothetical protein
MAAQGIDLWTVEGLYAGQTPRIQGPRVLSFDLVDALWHKERLLQLGVAWLPDTIDGVLWIDADVVFERRNLRDCVEEVLAKVPICQPWSEARYLNAAGQPMNGPIDVRKAANPDFSQWALEVPRFLQWSMAAENTGRMAGAKIVPSHPGLAWAARREWFAAIGIYQHNMAGSGDLTCCEGFWGRHDLQDRRHYSQAQWAHVLAWCAKCFGWVKGQVGYVPGVLRHLWHGSLRRRMYHEREVMVEQLGLDPERDLVCELGQPLRWSAQAPKELVSWLAWYLGARHA